MDKQEQRQKLIELATLMCDGIAPEAELDELAEQINRLSPDPMILDYLFHEDIGVDAALDKALSYRPIVL